MNIKVRILISASISFISTNIYWLISLTYVLQEVEYGENGVLWGIEAAQHLLSQHGIGAYLGGAYYYLLASFVVCLVAELTIKNYKKLVVFSYTIGYGFVGAVVYYLLTATVHIQDRANNLNVVIRGYDALIEQGLENILVGIAGVWIILSSTLLVDRFVKTVFQHKITGHP